MPGGIQVNDEKAGAASFVSLVADAYHQLYDLVALRTHPLGLMLTDVEKLTPKERAWHLHQLLIEAIHELRPTGHSQPQSREWRRYQLLNLRYIESLPPQQVAEKLSISRRQYFREQSSAIESLAEILRARRTDRIPNPESENIQPLLHELERVSKQERTTNLVEVIESVLSTVEHILEDKHLTITFSSPPSAYVSVPRSLLRQFLLGLVGTSLTDGDGSHLQFQTQVTGEIINLSIRAPSKALADRLAQEVWFKELSELIVSMDCEIALKSEEAFELSITFFDNTRNQRSVLIVDDNADMLALYERFLDQEGYSLQYSQDIEEAFEIIKTQRPYAVILDLMLPEHDGWELLARLKHDPSTSDCPVIICSVLKQQELAWTMGAARFLAKPITKSGLLEALDSLK